MKEVFYFFMDLIMVYVVMIERNVVGKVDLVCYILMLEVLVSLRKLGKGLC